jgi:hypothetical protein
LTNGFLVAIVVNVRLSTEKIGENMTRKDYEMIAKQINRLVLRNAYVTNHPENAHAMATLRDLTINLAIELGDDNPRFDPHTFYKACGITK